MKKIDVGQTATILANVGVIAGIVFLGLELHQNNELMEAEARRARALSAEESYRIVVENADIAELLAKDAADEDLSSVDQIRLNTFWMRNLLDIELALTELAENDLRPIISRQRSYFRSLPSLRGTWGNSKEFFTDEFVQWYDENVATD